jgi:mannose-1-phosphate guanylyltransferase
VGSWKALWEVGQPNADGVVVEGDCENIDSRNCAVLTQDSKLVALVGVEDLVIVETPDVLLVCSKKRTQEVRKVVENLRRRSLARYL